MSTSNGRVLWSWGLVLLVIASLATAGDATPAASDAGHHYAYATAGVTDHMGPWKLLVDESNLGGKELEIAEVTLAPGTTVPSHLHGSVEVIYVLSGTYDHEVNGKRYRLTPGMVGIVRPGDHVRHLVPATGPAKLMIIWAPAGEAKRVLGRQKGGESVPPVPEVAP
jgi:quercetin dioxygenase-like cupin family protein